jgi:hypothetical protein
MLLGIKIGKNLEGDEVNSHAGKLPPLFSPNGVEVGAFSAVRVQDPA